MKVAYFSPDCFYDTEARTLISKGQCKALTSKEISVLEYLIEYHDTLCENELIYEACWDADPVTMDWLPRATMNDAVKNVIKKLRAKDDSLKTGIRTEVGRGYRLLLPRQLNSEKTQSRAQERIDETYVVALEAYRQFWLDVDKVFIDSPHARKIKRYLYTDRDKLPENSEDMEMGLAVAELLRDTISYSEILLNVLPSLGYVEDHFRYKHMILESRLCKESMGQFRFSSESAHNLERDEIRYKGPIDLRAVVSFSKIFLDIDKLFIQSPSVLALRPYFYEKRNELPKDPELLSLSKSVCEYIKDQMQYSEALLPYIPEEHEDSYKRYRRYILDCSIMEESKKEYAFPWELRLK